MKRREFFGLSLLPITGIAGAAATGREYPLRGKVESPIWSLGAGGFMHNVQDWTLLRLHTRFASERRYWDSSRMVEVDIGGRREFVMTFEKKEVGRD